jgi:type IV pilus assembly protein PilB
MDAMVEVSSTVKRIYRPVGCPRCLGTGYRGRKAFFELMTANDALREAIVSGATPQSVRRALLSTQFQSLKHSGYQLVIEGTVAFAEIERIIGRAGD